MSKVIEFRPKGNNTETNKKPENETICTMSLMLNKMADSLNNYLTNKTEVMAEIMKIAEQRKAK